MAVSSSSAMLISPGTGLHLILGAAVFLGLALVLLSVFWPVKSSNSLMD